MGLHICVIKDGIDHPAWDSTRQGHDHEFSNLIDWDKVTNKNDEDQDDFRPTNIPELRAQICELSWDDAIRYLQLLDILEQDENVWLYFSW